MSRLVDSSDVTYPDDSLFFELGELPIGSPISASNACDRSIGGLIDGVASVCRLGRLRTTSAHDRGVSSWVFVFGVDIGLVSMPDLSSGWGVVCSHKLHPLHVT